MMKERITANDIEIGVHATDWEDAIRKSSRRLLEKGAIETNYVDAMVNAVKEIGPYIVIGQHVALAHARPECGANELAMSFTILDPPINFGSKDFDPIKLIVTLAAIDSNSHVEMLSELADVLMESEKMESLFQAKTSEEFYKVLI